MFKFFNFIGICIKYRLLYETSYIVTTTLRNLNRDKILKIDKNIY